MTGRGPLISMLVFTVATAALLVTAGARAADRPIAGLKLQLRRAPSGRQTLSFLSRDAAFPFPAAGGPDDPTAAGMTVELFSATDPQRPAFHTLTGIGKPGWKAVTGKYTYRNPHAVPGATSVKSVVLQQGRTMKIQGVDTGLALVGSQARVAIRVTTGGLRSCAVFGSGTIRRDAAGIFLAAGAAVPDVPDCSDASLTGQPATTTSTLVTSTTSTLPSGVTSTTALTSTTATTSTSSSTTSSTSTTTSTLLPPLLPLTVEFASLAGTGTCGTSRDGSDAVLDSLTCGDLALGAGTGTLAPSALPDGAVVHFALGGCSLLPLITCALDAVTTPGPGFDCTTTGCHFGPPVPVPNGPLSACAVSTFAAPVSGSVNLLTGDTTASIALDLHVFVTLDPNQPCPRCSATGAPGAIGSGTCDRGARAGLACTTTNSQGLSEDCLPGGSDGSIDVGSISAALTPVTTGSSAIADAGGVFCPGQTAPGCFGHATCRQVTETGSSPGVAINSALNPQPATLVSTFCIPATGNVVLDGPAGLPGPAAISLPGLVRSQT